MENLKPNFDPEKRRTVICELEDNIFKNQLPEIYDRYVGFFKWTTTIALAAILWIGVHSDLIDNDLLLNLSLALLLTSIILSICYFMRILIIMNDDLKLTIRHVESLKDITYGNGDKKEQWDVTDRLINKNPNHVFILNGFFW